MALSKIEDLNLAGSSVLVRSDLNVTFRPGSAEIADDSRVRASLPTVQLAISRGAKVLVCSHLGRPRGRVVEELRIEPVRERLGQLLGAKVFDAGGPTGEKPSTVMSRLPEGAVAMLENLRFEPGEEADDPTFGAQLADLADIHVNDAFGASHRPHASIVGIARNKTPYAGLLMRSEIEILNRGLGSSERPAVAVMGGAKVADKLAVITNLSRNVDSILIGGGMVAAFQQVQGLPQGAVQIADEETRAVEMLLRDSDVAGKLIFPTDVVAAASFSAGAEYVNIDRADVPNMSYILDIGPEATSSFVEILAKARKVIWNGPMGLFEWSRFSNGTAAVARAIANNAGCFSLAGGGSTAEAIASLGLSGKFTHVSTGGGASLEYLAGENLPGIAVLAKDSDGIG